MIYTIAVASKINKTLCYLGPNLPDQKNAPKPSTQQTAPLPVGALVKAPLGTRLITGVIIARSKKTPKSLNEDKLKSIDAVLPESLWLTKELVDLIIWAARYYHESIGKVVTTALPGSLLKNSLASLLPAPVWCVTANSQKLDGSAAEALSRAPKQLALYRWLEAHSNSSDREIREAGFTRSHLSALEKKQMIERGSVNRRTEEIDEKIPPSYIDIPVETLPSLTAAQSAALSKIFTKHSVKDPRDEKPALLNGVTGSGKTEVYLRAAEKVLSEGNQVLALVPEIGLTHQTERRFRERFSAPIYSYTSESTQSEKTAAWRGACRAAPAIFIGTRSAIFLPFSQLGLIVVDEEHDLSYKQQEGFRYNARDLAIYRANTLNATLILGSATPSIESLRNAQIGTFRHVLMRQRVSDRSLPKLSLREKSNAPNHALSAESLGDISRALEAGSQAIIFLNRRGYAPRLYCENCAWFARCPSCDTALCQHLRPAKLICHHCDLRLTPPRSCPTCQSTRLSTQGLGTQQLELEMQQAFPNTDCIRIDRDSTSRKGSFKAKMERAQQGDPCILVGTQMLTKGHHLPNLTLAIVLDVDQALFSHDYRASEHLGQLITQVAGRSGRGSRQGSVVVETDYTDHPLLCDLRDRDYLDFSRQLMHLREARNLPPFSHAAILRAESANLEALLEFMNAAASAGCTNPNVSAIGPMPATMERKQNRFRYQLNLSCDNRRLLHETLSQISIAVERLGRSSRIRWGFDVDPLTTD